MNVKECIRKFIEQHEGGLSVDPVDRGNWLNGVLVGSKYGVTGAVLAKHRRKLNVTPQEMAHLSIEEAVQIGFERFYEEPNLDALEWNQCTASILDMGWGAGPVQAVKLLQRMIEVADDGKIGPHTARAYAEYITDNGLEVTARAWANVRNAFYDRIIKVRPSNARFRNGWRNRTASFLPGGAWWKGWA